MRHPDVVSACVTMSGSFDIKSFLDGYYDDNVYFNSPPDYLPNMGDEWFLSRLRQMRIVLGTVGLGHVPGREREDGGDVWAPGTFRVGWISMATTVSTIGHCGSAWRKSIFSGLTGVLARPQCGEGTAEAVRTFDQQDRGH